MKRLIWLAVLLGACSGNGEGGGDGQAEGEALPGEPTDYWPLDYEGDYDGYALYARGDESMSLFMLEGSYNFGPWEGATSAPWSRANVGMIEEGDGSIRLEGWSYDEFTGDTTTDGDLVSWEGSDLLIAAGARIGDVYEGESMTVTLAALEDCGGIATGDECLRMEISSSQGMPLAGTLWVGSSLWMPRWLPEGESEAWEEVIE